MFAIVKVGELFINLDNVTHINFTSVDVEVHLTTGAVLTIEDEEEAQSLFVYLSRYAADAEADGGDWTDPEFHPDAWTPEERKRKAPAPDIEKLRGQLRSAHRNLVKAEGGALRADNEERADALGYAISQLSPLLELLPIDEPARPFSA